VSRRNGNVVSNLSEFYFAYPEVFLVPIEHLSPTGMSAPFARLVQEQRGISAAWVELFNQAVARYFERVSMLAEKAPKYWRKPRLANICIVQDAEHTRPYYQPFPQSSWLLYQSDFDPECSNAEHATYQLVHVERLGLTGDAGMTWIHNLSYFVARSPEERASFAAGCEASPRPDADAFRALGELMDALGSLYHDELRPGPASPEMATARIEVAGLTAPQEHREAIQALPKKCLAASHNVIHRYYQEQKRGVSLDEPERALVDWLKDTRPLVLLTDHLGGTVWDPDRANEVDGLRVVLEGIPSGATESLRADWSVIDRHSRAFLAAVVDPDELPLPTEDLDQEGGIYIHSKRKLIAYCLAQPGLRTLAEEAPPYHRMLVGARTVHEWGHLAVDAGMVAVPPELVEPHEQARRELLELFDEIVASAPDAQRPIADREVELLRREGYRLGDMPFQRVADYQANVLAREFLSVGEMEAYIRTNVRPLIDAEDVGPYLRLARHAYEYQYLLLSGIEDPFRYLVSSTWFAEQFFETGIVDEAKARELLGAVTALFSFYEIDTTRIRPTEGPWSSKT
jgi:hypothetical protein